MIATFKCNATLDRVRSQEVVGPPPYREVGKMWKGVAHGHLLDAVLGHAHTRGWVPHVAGIRLWLSNDGADLRASIPMKPGRLFEAEGLTPHLGLSTSTASRGVLTFYAGAVAEDDTPVVTGSYSRDKDVTWMYTTHFDKTATVRAGLDWWWDVCGYTAAAWKRLGSVPAGPELTKVHEVMFKIGQAEVIPWSRIGPAYQLVLANRHPTARDLLSAVGKMVLLGPPADQMKNALAAFAEVSQLKEAPTPVGV